MEPYIAWGMAMKCKRESDGRKLNHVALEAMRLQAVKAVRGGSTVDSVAKAFGMNIRTLFRWLSAYASGGQEALRAKPVPGRPCKVSEEEMRWIAQTVRDKTPLQMKFEFGLWTLSLIQALILRQFGKPLSLGTVRRVMWLLGFTAQKPLYRAWQQDAVLVEKWRTEEYPKLQAEAKRCGAVIYFADESGMRSDHHAGRTWAPSGETPTVETTGRRFSLNMISAISAKGEMRFMLHEGSVNAEVFLEFLQRLMRSAKQPIILVLDGHPIHKATKVKKYVEKQAGRLKLVYLPPYSPQLNPDEQVWGYVKTRVAKKLPQNKAQLETYLRAVLKRLQKLPDIVRSFFRHPDCQYATM
jgi:transposase